MVAFLYAILCVITHTTQKLKIVYRCFTYQMIALLSEISILLVRAVWRLLLASYVPKMHRNHFPIRHYLRTYTCNSKTTGHMLMFYILNDCSTVEDVYFSCVTAGCELQMASYTSKHASQSLSNLKTSGHMWPFSIPMTIIGDILVGFRVALEIQLASYMYSPRHALVIF